RDFYTLSLHDALPILAISFLAITLYHAFLSYGEVTVTAGAASLIIGAGPIFTALLAVSILNERLKILGWMGIFISFFGVALIALDRKSTRLNSSHVKK